MPGKRNNEKDSIDDAGMVEVVDDEQPTAAQGANEDLQFFDSEQISLDDDHNHYMDMCGQRLYGTNDESEEGTCRIAFNNDRRPQNGSVRKFSQRFSHQLIKRRSSLIDSLPDTPAGWTVLLSTLLSAGLGYEMRLQKSLTRPPTTFGQFPTGSFMSSVHHKLTLSPESILSRPIQPSLFVGTRGVVSSTAAYLFGGPASSHQHLRFREIVTSPIDGASFAVDWEVPLAHNNNSNTTTQSSAIAEERKKEILQGPIPEPVVVILHGINNDTSFGYMRSLQRSFASRGWNAAAMNFRGCGGVSMTTPRGYNASNSNDLRSLVWVISGRLGRDVPVFLVGNSLGASVLTKYLGEEGMSGTLPKCVSGAAGLGNPLSINSSLVSFPFNVLMAMGVKKTLLKNWSVFNKMNDLSHRQCLRNALLSTTIANLDNSMAPILARNDPFYPFAFRIGYKDGNSYWLDSSSFRLIRFINVPFFNITAEDDFLVAAPNKNKLGFCIANPNVMVIETRCGGHLGWQETPPDSQFGIASSWADVATADFFDAVMKTNMERHGSPLTIHVQENHSDDQYLDIPATAEARQALRAAASTFNVSKLKSKL